MIGALIALLLSWIVLHFLEHRSILVLGFWPKRRRLRLIGSGFLLTLVFMSAYYLAEAAGWRYSFRLNHTFSASWLFTSMGTVLVSALFEELLFRGALLYILVRRIGEKKAVLISALAFGMYHWIIVGIHSFPQMMLLFISMAWLGYALARSFVVSGSILIPLALHFAGNFVGADLFGDGAQLFVHAPGRHPATAVVFLLLAIHNFLYPLVLLWWLKRNKKKWLL
ncbi:MAG TPA: CPBP family intramembrane glutamic endopeptidase [Puia sp.]|nr:CPBP family intramembrane glutamic endopeptidase [Puia sp.]